MWGAFPKETVKLLLKFPAFHYLLSIDIYSRFDSLSLGTGLKHLLNIS